MLVYMSAAHHLDKTVVPEAVLTSAWFLIVGILILVGFAYPVIQARTGLKQGILSLECAPGTEGPGSLSPRRYLGIYGCLLRRYMGVLLGGLLILLCIWCIAYRIATGIYPFQLELLTTGVEAEAAQLIADIQAHLSDLLS